LRASLGDVHAVAQKLQKLSGLGFVEFISQGPYWLVTDANRLVSAVLARGACMCGDRGVSRGCVVFRSGENDPLPAQLFEANTRNQHRFGTLSRS